MSSVDAKLDRAFVPLAEAVAQKRIPGGVLGFLDADGNRAVRTIGSAQTVPFVREMSEDTWFDLASLTKVLFTTDRILGLAEAGTIDLDAPLTSVLPDFRQYDAGCWERQITFRQCLGHQTPLPAVFPIYTYDRDPDQLRHFVLQHQWQAGSPVYSDINFILLGLALERITGKRIREQDPGPGFAWSADPESAAATENDPWRGRVLCGEVHDENCSSLRGSGHAGLFGTAAVVLDFAEARLRNGRAAVIDPHATYGQAHPWLGAALRRLVWWRSLLAANHWPHGFHRHGPVDRFRARTRLDASDQSRPPDAPFRQRHRRAAPCHRRPDFIRLRRHCMKPIWAVGLMTGTVLDGNIDVALLKTDGETVEAFGAYTLAPYTQDIRDQLAEAQAQALDWNFEGPDPAIFAKAEDALTRAQSAAVSDLVLGAGLSLSDVGVVGFHGQTVLHRAPQPGRIGDTRQLGDGALMHDLLGVPVAYDMRSADVKAGGQGAPLAAIYHRALLKTIGATDGKTAVLNLGGVANITWWDGADRLIAFDTGPANAPINDFIKLQGLGDMDRDGALALKGSVDEARLAKLLEHPYLTAPFPKSLDRFDFSATMAEGLSPEDGAATLTAFTTSAVGKALDLLPERPDKLIVCGGGRHNPAIMDMLTTRARVTVEPAEAVGWRGDAVEAECFAFLAVRVLDGRPISFPTTTGAPKPMTGGRLAA